MIQYYNVKYKNLFLLKGQGEICQATIDTKNKNRKFVGYYPKIKFLKGSNDYIAGLFFLLFVLFIIGWCIFKISIWIKDIRCSELSQLLVIGKLHYTTNDDIRQAVYTFDFNKNFIDQDISIIFQYIKQLSWIKKVIVCKQWPNILKIHIVEYDPVVFWNDIYMLDNDGVIFQIPIERINENFFPMLYGPEGSVLDVLTGYRILNEVIQSTSFKIQSVTMNDRCSWQMVLQKNIKLELGRRNKVKKLQRFIKVYPLLFKNIIDNNQNKYIHYIDLRYDSGFAVSWLSYSNFQNFCDEN